MLILGLRKSAFNKWRLVWIIGCLWSSGWQNAVANLVTQSILGTVSILLHCICTSRDLLCGRPGLPAFKIRSSILVVVVFVVVTNGNDWINWTWIKIRLKPVPPPPRGDIFVLYCCYCLQQKWPNQNTLFAHKSIGPGLMVQEEGFCSVKYSSSHIRKFSKP